MFSATALIKFSKSNIKKYSALVGNCPAVTRLLKWSLKTTQTQSELAGYGGRRVGDIKSEARSPLAYPHTQPARAATQKQKSRKGEPLRLLGKTEND
jgi:hypothetical protein